jgi:predicted O-methyltransferase YrrM
MPDIPTVGQSWLTRARRSLFTIKEFLSLLTVPKQQCEPGAAGKVQTVDLSTLFLGADLQREWQRVAILVENLGISDESQGVNPGDRRALYYLVRHLRPRGILEIGTHVGASTVHLAIALADAHGDRNDDVELVTVDVEDANDPQLGPWRRYGMPKSPSGAVESLGCRDLVSFRVARSLEVLLEEGRQFDLIFLDGDHRAASVYAEIPAALRRLSSGGFVLLHDYFSDLQPLWGDGAVIPGPRLAVAKLQRADCRIAVRPLGVLPWPTKLGSSTTSLALLGRS